MDKLLDIFKVLNDIQSLKKSTTARATNLLSSYELLSKQDKFIHTSKSVMVRNCSGLNLSILLPINSIVINDVIVIIDRAKAEVDW